MNISDAPVAIAYQALVNVMAKQIVRMVAMSKTAMSPAPTPNTNARTRISALTNSICAMVKTIVRMVTTS